MRRTLLKQRMSVRCSMVSLPSSPPDPLAFAALCCRANWECSIAPLQQASARPIDWDLQLSVFRRHRIEGLAWRSLLQANAGIPETIARQLEADANRIRAQNLIIAAECFRLQRLFAHAGLECLFLKGLTVAQLAYGSILTKSGWDIDLLIARERLPDAARVLKEAGYVLLTPPDTNDERQLVAWHRVSKESVWAKNSIVLELHTSVADHPDLLPSIGLASPRQEVAIATGAALPTLAPFELFAYLCVHGASSAWFRLKWASDLAALISKFDPPDIEHLYERSQAMGAHRAAGLGLLICHWLFNTQLPTHLLAALAEDRAHRRLLDLSRGNLLGRAMTTELRHLPWGTRRIHVTQFLLSGSLSYKAKEGIRSLRRLRGRLLRIPGLPCI